MDGIYAASGMMIRGVHLILDLSDDEKSNGGGDSSDGDAENITNQRDND